MMIPIFLICALLLAACGGRANRGNRIDVETHDLWYGQRNDNMNNPPTWTIASGTKAKVRLDNEGVLEHNFTILKPGAEAPVPFRKEASGDLILFATEDVEKGTMKEFSLPMLEPGEYLVICSVLGHFPLMQGKLEVR